jgi:ketosteroid isomerase-like protein
MIKSKFMNNSIDITSLFLFLIFGGVLIGGVITSSFGQSTFNQKYGTENDYKRLYFLNIQYIQSWVKSDTNTYNKLLWADDFVHQNSSDGHLYTKERLSPIFGEPRFDSIDYFYAENISIRFINSDAAMIFARTPFHANGSASESVSQYNDLYVKRNGKWLCVSASVTKIIESSKGPAELKKIPEYIQLMSYTDGSAKDEQILKTLNGKHAEAFAKSDATLLKPILADDFVLLSENGLLYSKEEVLKQLQASTDNSIATYYIENYTIRFVASDLAIIHGAFIANTKGGKKTGTQYNDIYVKRDDSWLCVSGNNTPIQ